MTKVIKRYSNRKIYDTQVGAYVDFAALAQMIHNHIDFKVICHTTKNDITGTTLCQMMLENEKTTQFKLDLKVLKEVVRAGSISTYFGMRDVMAEVEDKVA